MLNTNNLCYEYDKTLKGSKKAIDNINLSLNQGDILGIIGKTVRENRLWRSFYAAFSPLLQAKYF